MIRPAGVLALAFFWSPATNAQDLQRITLDGASIAEVTATFAHLTGRSIILGEDLQTHVTAEIPFQDWEVAFETILDAHDLRAVEDSSGIIVVVRRGDGDIAFFGLRPALAEDFWNVSATWNRTALQEVVDVFAEFSGLTITMAEGVEGCVTAEIRDQPWNEAFSAILAAHGLEVDEDSVGRLEVVPRRQPRPGGLPASALPCDDGTGGRAQVEALRVTSIYHDPQSPSRSLAVLRDTTVNRRFVVRVGDRVSINVDFGLSMTDIGPYRAIVTIEDTFLPPNVRQDTLQVRRRGGPSMRRSFPSSSTGR